ncbi:MAG: hypothetical protein GY953_35800 [bacterium]|nr:hypothetical protein [bacterium]
MTKQEALISQIEALSNAIPELNGVLLASSDGLPIAHSISNGADPARIAAMAAAAASLGTRVSNSVDCGAMTEVGIRGSGGNLFIYSAGSKAVLAVISDEAANAGLIHIEARSTAGEIADLFAG